MTMPLEYDDGYFDRQYRGRRLGNRSRARYWSRWIRKRVDGWVLEVGPGLGDFAAVCRNPIVAIDISRAALSASKSRGAQAVTEASAECLPFRASAFGSIVALDVLEHLESPRRAFLEFSRVVAPGGFIIVSVPNVNGIGARSKRGRDDFDWFGDTDPTHRQLIPARQWVSMATDAGLAVSRVGSDAPWDAPYPLPIPLRLQHACAVLLQVTVSMTVGLLPWSFGENVILIAKKPCESSM